MNKIFKRDPIEQVYNRRIQICKACPHMDKTDKLCVMPKTQPCCGICGCSLALKLRSMDSSCPHPEGPKWKEEKI